MKATQKYLFVSVCLIFEACTIVLVTGCRDEQYHGPFQVHIPSDLMERSSGKIFQIPLSATQVRQQELLDRCLDSTTSQSLPCACQHPVLTLYNNLIQMDYRVTLVNGQHAEVLIWLGVEAGINQSFPNILPDLPRAEVITSHHHLLVNQGDTLQAVFLEKDITDMLLVFARDKYSECDLDYDQLPVPARMLFGMSLLSEGHQTLDLDVTFRTRRFR